jgi:thiol-disulfide isomerase/thioredoxin
MTPTLSSRARAFAASLLLLASFGAAAAIPGAGDTPPDRIGTTFDGDPVLLSKYKGTVVVVSFWATWCTYCLKELPILDGIQRVGKERVRVVAVNTEERDVFRKVRRLLGDKLAIDLVYDPGKGAQTAFGVSGIPHLLIIGRDGKIVNVYRGYGESSLDGITADLNRAIDAAPAPAGAP